MNTKIDTIYIVDDDPIIVYSMKRLMKEMDFYNSLCTFDNGKAALEALKNINKSTQDLPSILFLDLAMPIMNGWEFLDEYHKIDFKEKQAHPMRIIVISSSVNTCDIQKIKSYPLVEKYIVKPVTPSDLLQL